MRNLWLAAVAAISAAAVSAREMPPLLAPDAGAAIATEVSGTAAKRAIQAITLNHRMRASSGYRAAADYVRGQLDAYGLTEVGLIELPADGKRFYGTQRSRPAWEVEFAELWEQRADGGRRVDAERIASWAEQPITLAQDSVGGAATTTLVDVGSGAAAADYAGKDVRGKLVLVSGQPEAAAPLAVGRFGAAGIVSWAQNQKQAWWGDDQSLVRWGHLETFADPTFAFMVSPARARAWQGRLSRGEPVYLRAEVKAAQKPGAYTIATGLIPGRTPGGEIVLSCHLDHQRPGANDNASGCAGILEVARTLSTLIAGGKLPQPRHGIRFVWPPEVEGTIALLNGRPEFAARTLATIHLDMIGGDTEVTKSVLRVHRSPASLPSFVNDVAEEMARFVNDQSMAYAESGAADWPLTDPAGDKRALQALIASFDEGSDHQIWAEGSWRVPAIYVADWPDRYIHTDRDSVANIDATKLRRAIFIAAASAGELANLDDAKAEALLPVLRRHMLARSADTAREAAARPAEAANLWRFRFDYEAALLDSLARFATVPAASLAQERAAQRALRGLLAPGAAAPADADPRVYRRAAAPKGPMNGFGYSWFDDRLAAAGLPRPALADRGSYAYEALNLVDGIRSVGRIRDDLSAIYGDVPLTEVADYLATLEKLKLIAPAR